MPVFIHSFIKLHAGGAAAWLPRVGAGAETAAFGRFAHELAPECEDKIRPGPDEDQDDNQRLPHLDGAALRQKACRLGQDFTSQLLAEYEVGASNPHTQGAWAVGYDLDLRSGSQPKGAHSQPPPAPGAKLGHNRFAACRIRGKGAKSVVRTHGVR